MGGTNSKSTIDAKWKASDGSTTFGDADTIVATTSPPPDSNGDWGIIRCPNQEKNIVFPKEGLGDIISEAAPVYENEKPENITVFASARKNISVGDYCKSSHDAWIDSDSTYATKKGKITLNKFDRIPKWLPKSGNKCDPPGCHCLIDEKNPSLPGKDLCIVAVDRTKPGFSSCAEVCASVTNLSSCANYNKDKTPKQCNVDRYPTVLPKKIKILNSPSEGVIEKDTPGGKKTIAMILASLRDRALKLPTLVVEEINDPAKTGKIFLIILVIGILITWYRRRNRITEAF